MTVAFKTSRSLMNPRIFSLFMWTWNGRHLQYWYYHITLVQYVWSKVGLEAANISDFFSNWALSSCLAWVYMTEICWEIYIAHRILEPSSEPSLPLFLSCFYVNQGISKDSKQPIAANAQSTFLKSIHVWIDSSIFKRSSSRRSQK